AVLEDVRERELEQVLVEVNRLLDIGTEHCCVVQTPRRRGWPFNGRAQMGFPDPGPSLLDGPQVDVGHGAPRPCSDSEEEAEEAVGQLCIATARSPVEAPECGEYE